MSRNGRTKGKRIRLPFYLPYFVVHRTSSARKEKNMFNRLRNFLTILLLSLTLPVIFTSCDLAGGGDPIQNDPSIAVKGTWEIPGDWPEKWIITDTTIESVGNYKAQIAEFSNEGLNGGDTSLIPSGTTLGLGYAVIKFTEVSGASTGTLGKYQIFRWGTNTGDSTKRNYTQGYKNVGAAWPNNVNQVFDTPLEAKNGATNASGHFSFASLGAVKL